MNKKDHLFNTFYGSIAGENFKNLFNPELLEPTKEKPIKSFKEYFAPRISEDVINLYKKYKDNAEGMSAWGPTGELVTLDKNLIEDIKEYLLEHPESTEEKDYNENSKEISIYVRGLCGKYGKNAIGMESIDMNGNPITITPKLYEVVQRINKKLFPSAKKQQIQRYQEPPKTEPTYVEPSFSKETRMSNFYDKLLASLKFAEEEFDSFEVPEEEVQMEQAKGGQQESNDANTCFHIFLSDPNPTTFKQLISAIQSTLGSTDQDRYGRDEISELLEIARREGANWITEDNIRFLFEMFAI